MKILTRSLFFRVALLLPILLYAQEGLEHKAPTLQVGLDGLSFGKGTLNPEIVMQIIADKQKEIGLKVAQNMFLEKMYTSGGAFYSYTDNIIRTIITEKNPDLLSRKVLENTINITVTYAFADYYIKYAFKTGNTSKLDALLAKASLIGCDYSKGLLGLKKDIKYKSSSGDDIIEESSDSDISKEIIALIIDMSSEAIRKNAVFQDLGVLQVSYSQSYDYMNKYLVYTTEPEKARGLETRAISSGTLELEVEAKNVFNEMETLLNDFSNMIGLLYFHKNANSYRLNTSSILANFITPTTYTPATIATGFDDLKKSLEKIIPLLQAKRNVETDTSIKRKLDSDIKLLNNYYFYINKAFRFSQAHVLAPTNTNPKELIIYSDIVFTLYGQIVPNLTRIAAWDFTINSSIDIIDNICRTIQGYYLADVTNRLSNPWVKENMENFIQIISCAYQFDKASTFTNSLKILSLIENVFPDNRTKDALSIINTFVRDFVIVKRNDKNVEYIEIDVESFLVKLNTLKPERIRRASILFTVGTNTCSFDKKIYAYDSTGIRNFSFIGEKIGIKFKLWDRAFWKTRNPGESYFIRWSAYTKKGPPKEPVLSDVNFIAYASGILYHFVNTGTTKNFDYPLVGAGIGFNFFNNLNANISIGTPIRKSEELFTCTYLNFGLDFPFVEYIQRVNQNRKDNQNRKLLAESDNSSSKE